MTDDDVIDRRSWYAIEFVMANGEPAYRSANGCYTSLRPDCLYEVDRPEQLAPLMVQNDRIVMVEVIVREPSNLA